MTTVEPQSYGLHSYGKLGQPDTEIEYIFGKYHRGTGTGPADPAVAGPIFLSL